MAKQTINVGTTANDKKGDSLRAAFQKVNANFTELYTALGLNSDGTLNLGAFTFTGSTMSTDDSTNIVIDRPITVNGEITVDGDITPSVANGSNLGSPTKPFRSLYVSNNTIYIGGTALRIDNNGKLTVGGTTATPTFTGSQGITANIDANNNVTVGFSGTLQSGSQTWKFNNDSSITLPNYGQLRPSSSTYDAALAGWESFRSEEAATAALLGITAENRPFIEWRVNGGNVAEYLAELDRVWAIQNTGGATPVWTPPISSSLRAQMRVAMQIVQTAYSSIGSDVSISSGQGKYWNFSGDGTLTIPGDIKSNGNINIDINLSDSTLHRWQFGEDGELTTPGGIQVSGILKIDDGVQEKFQTLTGATGTVTHDCSLGQIFYHTTPAANWSANFTNLILNSTYATTVTLVIAQGATGYYPNAVRIDYAVKSISWKDNVAPTPSTNRTDVVTFTIINNDDTYTVLGELIGY